MIIVGEKINTSLKGVTEAVQARDADFIINLARYQQEFGAHYIDVNCGTLIDEEEEALPWLVEVVQAAVDLPCCVDSPNPKALATGLKVHRGQALINSITNENQRYSEVLPLVQEYQGKVVALVIDDEHGMPETAQLRIKVGNDLIRRLNADGVENDRIYIDPLVQPISSGADMGVNVLETIMGIAQMNPGIHFMCGMSNVSYGLPKRGLLNATFMALCMMAGLDGAILDPGNKRMMATIYAAEALLNKDRRTKRYLAAFRSGLLDI